MPEYLAPGVFVEETSFRSKSIEGVSTTTTGFIGPTRYGPVELDNEVVTSLLEFERSYGSRRQLEFDGILRHNYTWHAVRAFFEEGGKRLYVSRVFRAAEDDDGKARGELGATGGYSYSAPRVAFEARYPGAAGNGRVQLTLGAGQNVLSVRKVSAVDAHGAAVQKEVCTVAGLQDRDVVLISKRPAAGEWSEARGVYFLARRGPEGQWTFTDEPSTPDVAYPLDKISSADALEIRVIAADVTWLPDDDLASPGIWSGLALDPAHQRDGAPDSLRARFLSDAHHPSRNREIPVVVDDEAADGLDLLHAILEAGKASLPEIEAQLQKAASPPEQRTVTVRLEKGNDGLPPTASEYEGSEVPNSTRKTGLKQFEDLEDISIVAAPGVTFQGGGGEISSDADAVTRLLIGHCERMRYRVAVLDGGNGMTISEIRKMRATLDSKHAALYYPWIVVTDPLTRQQIPLPPSGFVAGIYARNDVNRAVYKAPANEVVTLAQGFEAMLNRAQQEVLNPEGINAFRFFEGRGFRLWGARTISSDPEWKYVNVRRYFAYLERSIDKGTQWAVFEPNGDALWANVRRTIEDFLLNEWQTGALLGDKPDKAFFVRCDRSTMTQNDLDNGRLICLIGVSALKPAEFVIFRIGQWTADRK